MFPGVTRTYGRRKQSVANGHTAPLSASRLDTGLARGWAGSSGLLSPISSPLPASPKAKHTARPKTKGAAPLRETSTTSNACCFAFEVDDDDGDDDGDDIEQCRRRPKRGEPGTPGGEENPTSSKSKRLFSPTVVKPRGRRLRRSSTMSTVNAPVAMSASVDEPQSKPKRTGTIRRQLSMSSCAATPMVPPSSRRGVGRTSARSTERSVAASTSVKSAAMSITRESGPSSTAASAGCADIFEDADAEDVALLADRLAAPESSWRSGFGCGFEFHIPSDADSGRRARLRQLCTRLGFQMKAKASKVCYQMSREKASKLRRELMVWRGKAIKPVLSRWSTMESTCSMSTTQGGKDDDHEAYQSSQESGSGGVKGVVQCLEALVLETNVHDDGPAWKRSRPRPSPVILEMLCDNKFSNDDVLLQAGQGEDHEGVADDEMGTEMPGEADETGATVLLLHDSPTYESDEDKGLDMSVLSVLTECEAEKEEDDDDGSDGGARACDEQGESTFYIRRRLQTSGSGLLCMSSADPSPTTTPLSACTSPVGHLCRRGSATPEVVRRLASPRLSGAACAAGSSAGHAGLAHAVFATPVAARIKTDWGVSVQANTRSIQRLTDRFKDFAPSDDVMIPSHYRYSLGPSPSGPAHDSDLSHEAETKRRRSLAKARRVSVSLAARHSSLLATASSTSSSFVRGRPSTRTSLSTALGALSMSSPSESEVGMPVPASTSTSTSLHTRPSRSPAKKRPRWGLNPHLTAACLEFLPLRDVSEATSAVSRCFASAALHAHAAVLSDLSHPRPEIVVQSLTALGQDYPCGQFLADGAFKSVYRVWSDRRKRVEAVSVMDIAAIAATGNAAVVRQELTASLLMAALVRKGICPNHVETYGVMRSTFDPRELWSCSDTDFRHYRQAQQQGTRRPRLGKARVHKAKPGDYQLIRMELCRHGDLEDHLRRQPQGVVPETVAREMLFQMCFALYSARQANMLRHYDVKLLNFLVADFHTTSSPASPHPGTPLAVRYGFAREVYRINRRTPHHAHCVKLADFGTADMSLETLGQPVGIGQFTTVENAPIDFYVEGNAATQDFAADTFSLGLAAVHLFTGAMPYEEIMDAVRCPQELCEALMGVWKRHERYTVVRDVMASWVADGLEGQEDDLTLCHTLYRYLVLLGLPSKDVMCAPDHPLWAAVAGLIAEDLHAASLPAPKRGRGGRKQQPRARITAQYWSDHAQFSLQAGEHPLIKRGRERLLSLPGAMELVQAFLSYKPTQRPTMYAALTSAMFEPLRESTGGRGSLSAAAPDCLNFMAYYGGGGRPTDRAARSHHSPCAVLSTSPTHAGGVSFPPTEF